MDTTRLHLGEYDDFKFLSEEDLAKFRHSCYMKSSTIYANNIKFIILKSGSAKLSYVDKEKEFIINFLESGNMVFLDTNCILETLSNSEILELSLYNLTELFYNKQFSMSLINSLIRDTIMQRQLISEIIFGNLESRLINFLNDLLKKQRTTSKDRPAITLPFSITVLANLLGFERQSVSTIFNKLIKDGVLQKCGKNSYIFNQTS